MGALKRNRKAHFFICMAGQNSLSLLSNAVNSIRVGVEDSNALDRGRWVAAVRNIHAGILLLYKEKLRRMSPPGSDDVLLKTRITPFLQADGTVSFKGAGLHTVDMQQIQARFGALQIGVDWNALKSVTLLRNRMEHYFENEPKQAVFEVIAKSYLLVRDFMRDQLQEDPLDLLGADAWMRMLDKSDILKKEKEASAAAIRSHRWVSPKVIDRALEAICEDCGSTLLGPEGDDIHSGLQCLKCGHSMAYYDFLIDPQSVYKNQELGAATDAMRMLACPACREWSFVVALGLCGDCGHEADPTCFICGTQLSRSGDLAMGNCPYCREVHYGIPLA